MANEKRLIDANALDRVLEDFENRHAMSCFVITAKAISKVRQIVYAMKDVDAVEVVRCEKCLYRSQYCDENGLYKCGGIQNENGDCFLMVESTHFCAFGKLRGKFGAKMDGDGDA